MRGIALFLAAMITMAGGAFAVEVTPTAVGADGGVQAPTAAQAEAAFRAAREAFMTVAEGSAEPEAQEGDLEHKVEPVYVNGGEPENVALQDVQLMMDVENLSLKDVMVRGVRQAAAHTGPWTVKWRLKPENSELMNERVNLTAETTFGDFVTLLTERVKNMSGVQLYVTVFEGARMVLVTDTYY